MFNKKLIILLIGIYIFWLCILPTIVTNVFEQFCNNYSHNSKYEIQVKDLKTKFSFLPVVTFKAGEVFVKAKNDSAEVKVNDLKLNLRLLPLLSGRAHVNTLSLGKISLSAKLVDDLELDKDFFTKFEHRKFKFNTVKVGEFEAKLYQKEIKNPIIYIGKDFLFQRKNKYITLKNNSVLNVDGKVSKVVSNLYLPKNNDINKTVFDIDVANIDVSPLRLYFRHYLPKDLKELKGDVHISATKEGLITEFINCKAIMEDSAKSIIFPEKLYVKSKFNITRNYIKFENIDIESKNIHASMDGRISDYFGKVMPTLDLNVRLNKSRVEDIVNLLPAFEVEEIDTYELKKHKFYADILANFSIKGRLPEPDIIGDIYINDGVLIKPIPNTTKGATIKLSMTGRNSNFDVVVPTGGLEKVLVKGSQELYGSKFANLTVKSSESVDLKVAQVVLIPLHKILNFIIGPVPIMDISGKGNIDIIVKGNRKNPHIWGIFNMQNVQSWFNDAPDYKLYNTNATLKFEDQNALFATQSASLNNKDVQIKGSCNLFGKFDFDVFAINQPVKQLYNSAKTTTFIPNIEKILPKLDSIDGFADLNLKFHGMVQDLNKIEVLKNIFAKGEIKIKDNRYVVQNVEINKINGFLKFDNVDFDTDIDASIANLPLKIKAKVKNDISDIMLDIPKLNPNFLISDIETRQKHLLPYISVLSKYNGKFSEIEYPKLSLKAQVLGSVPQSNIKYNSEGKINLANNKLEIKNLKGFINNAQNTFDINLLMNKIFDKKIDANGKINLKTPDLSLYNEILASNIFPENIRKYFKDFEFKSGVLDLNAKIDNNKLNINTDLNNISFVYLPLEMPVEVINGNLSSRNNVLYLNKINLLADKMPLLIDGDIKDIFDKQIFNLYFNSKPQQEFIDKYINKNQIYPIKIKGDIVYWVRLKGVAKDYDLKAEIDMSKDSSFYHFGATIGDIENAIEVSIDSRILDGNIHKIREFSYDKVIDSQSGRQTHLNMLKAYGGVQIFNDDLIFNNLRIKTSHPTDARIFNIIFRKPNIKQGQFTSDLKINGKLSDPKVLGDFHIFETNIPFLDTTMKNIELVFKDKTINFDTKGEVIGNAITFNGILKNKLTIPYRIEKAYFYTKDLDLNQIVNKLKLAGVENDSSFESFEGFDLTSIVAKDFHLKADNIKLRNIHATDFEATTSLNEKGVFDVGSFKFNIAQGLLNGKYSYNLKNNDMNIALQAEKISANDLTWALFDLNNQIYGDLTGNINLSCEGSEFNRCMETLSGNTVFNVKNGRMPKLGSLEYLLKAGNLVKGGLTGISINGVIDLLAPSKTGDFEDIFGSIRIKDGVARNIEITTKGDDLSMFIGGTYNFATSIADMEVLGLLSRKISTMFGPIGNLSINTLFNVIPGVDLSKDSLVLERINKIPGIELSSKEFRKFIAEIKGNINGDDYVTSFKWIN